MCDGYPVQESQERLVCDGYPVQESQEKLGRVLEVSKDFPHQNGRLAYGRAKGRNCSRANLQDHVSHPSPWFQHRPLAQTAEWCVHSAVQDTRPGLARERAQSSSMEA